MEYRLLNSAGGFRWRLVRATPMRDSSGTNVKRFGARTDIDEQMRYQQVLEDQIKQHTGVDANPCLQSEVRERALGAAGTEPAKRAHAAGIDHSNRVTNLAKMAELLQSCSDVKSAFLVVAGLASKVFPELRGALFLFTIPTLGGVIAGRH